MAARTVHFVYTVPRSQYLGRRVVDRALPKIGLAPLHRLGVEGLIPWGHPIRAPHAISYNLLKALQSRYRVRFYSMYERGAAKLRPGDIFIGHPAPAGGMSYEGRPDRDDHGSVTSATLRKYQGSDHQKLLIVPYAHDDVLWSWARDLAENYADKIVLIGGAIWTHNWDRGPFRHVDLGKCLQVDMGIDPQDYPRVKTQFNSPGKRKYLYIGHNAWYKNTQQLEKIAAAIPGFEGAHIGGGAVSGWKKISNFAVLTPEFMKTLAEEYDIFVTTSTADAQATTILEQMCFGLAVACTPETGYDHPSLYKLKPHDTEHNVTVLTQLQQLPSTELLATADANRHVATTCHTWKSFCDKIINFIQ